MAELTVLYDISLLETKVKVAYEKCHFGDPHKDLRSTIRNELVAVIMTMRDIRTDKSEPSRTSLHYSES
jgi:hypothetical protein